MSLTSRFDEALLFAAELHREQRRKGSGVPYLSHLLAVSAVVIEHGGDEDEAIAALLHDAIEDQGGAATREEIRRRFGQRVTQIVDSCTDSDAVPKPPWRERKDKYLALLATAERSALLVSAADKLHNARSIVHDYRQIGAALWPRFTAGREGALWYYRQVTDVLLRAFPGPLSAELAEVVDELEQLAAQEAGAGAAEKTS